WYYDYLFGEDIIGEAYDLTVMNKGKLSLPYMDKLLSRWHECDCKTVEDCKRVSEKEKPEKKDEGVKKSAGRIPKPPKSTPRYGNFDVEDAYKKALMRSYGDAELVEKMLQREKNKG
ncbi:MAG: DnaD domain protein, partial [Clostridia bacterium]|nr:DnaD domain protein [Clostridia bacterium]